MALFKRCWRLSIQIDDVVKTYQELANDETSLKIDFNVDSSFNGTFSNGEITITGLTQRDIAFLSTKIQKCVKVIHISTFEYLFILLIIYVFL